MPMLFTVKWPYFAQLEAALLFPVTVATAAQITAAQFGFAEQTGSQRAASLAALTVIVAVPFVGMLVVVDRLLVMRKGFALLACLATLTWILATTILTDGVVALLPASYAAGLFGLSFRAGAVLAMGTTSFLAHLKILWIGLLDGGSAAMHLGVERRLDANGLMSGRYIDDRDLPSDEADQTRSRMPKPGRRVKRVFRNLYGDEGYRGPIETVLALILIGGWIYGSYRWIYSANHGSGAHASVALILVKSDPVPKLPIIAGAASTDRDSAGRFVFDAAVNGVTMRMVYDDDIPQVTLRAEDAIRLGISFAKLNFADKIKAPKGMIDVAGITIGTMTVGSITYKLVPGFVAKQGALEFSILGHSFLGRLATDQLQNNRLIFTGAR